MQGENTFQINKQPGWVKYDERKYLKTLKLEAQKRHEIMQQINNTHSIQPIPSQMHNFMGDNFNYDP